MNLKNRKYIHTIVMGLVILTPLSSYSYNNTRTVKSNLVTVKSENIDNKRTIIQFKKHSQIKNKRELKKELKKRRKLHRQLLEYYKKDITNNKLLENLKINTLEINDLEKLRANTYYIKEKRTI